MLAQVKTLLSQLALQLSFPSLLLISLACNGLVLQPILKCFGHLWNIYTKSHFGSCQGFVSVSELCLHFPFLHRFHLSCISLFVFSFILLLSQGSSQWPQSCGPAGFTLLLHVNHTLATTRWCRKGKTAVGQLTKHPSQAKQNFLYCFYSKGLRIMVSIRMGRGEERPCVWHCLCCCCCCQSWVQMREIKGQGSWHKGTNTWRGVWQSRCKLTSIC